MRISVRTGIGLVVLTAGLSLMAGCGKGNMFSFAHSSGSSSDTASLSSDAYTALVNKDYAKALECYNKILENVPANSEAIYGAAAAELGKAGLDIPSLVSNLVKQQNSPSINGLNPAMADIARSGGSATDSLIPQLILNNSAIRAAVDTVLSDSRLKRIITGHGDGSISPDNADVNLNVAFCLIMRAAFKANGVITYTSDYSHVLIHDSDPVRLTNAAEESLRDIASARARLLVVIRTLHLDNDATIKKIDNDVVNLFNTVKNRLATDHFITVSADINTDYYIL